MPDPTPAPPAPSATDPGLIVTTAEVQTYGYQVDNVIRAINARVLETPPDKTPMDLWMKWVAFRVAWEKVFNEVKGGGWLATNYYDEIRGYHLEALRWRDRWGAAGVPVADLQLLQPSDSYRADVPVGDLLPAVGAVGLAVGVGAAALLIYLMGRR